MLLRSCAMFLPLLLISLLIRPSSDSRHSNIFALVNRGAYHPQDPTHPLLKKTPHQLVPFFELTRPSEYDSVYSDSISRIFGCHFPITGLPKSIFEDDISTNNCKIVYLCRDIKDTFASLFHFANNANLRSCPIDLEEAFDLFCKGVTAGGPIWDQILGYWEASLKWPEKVLFMRYEELKYDSHVQLRRLAKFIGKPFSEEEETSGMIDEIISLCSFGNMSKVKVNMTGVLLDGLPNCSFFRSGVIGDGKKCLTAPMAAKLDQITKDKFSGSGLSL